MKKKLMICLYAVSDMGKTETIRALAEKLKILPKPANDKAIKYEYNRDICATTNLNGNKIGLSSHGDYPHVVEKWLNFLVNEQKCDLIFCASRTKGNTVEVVNDMAKDNGYTLIWTAPYSDNNEPKEKLSQFQRNLNWKNVEHLMDIYAWYRKGAGF